MNKDNMKSLRGYVQKGYTVWCICANWDQVSGSLKHCEAAWKQSGWKKTKWHGWLCPNCVKIVIPDMATK